MIINYSRKQQRGGRPKITIGHGPRSDIQNDSKVVTKALIYRQADASFSYEVLCKKAAAWNVEKHTRVETCRDVPVWRSAIRKRLGQIMQILNGKVFRRGPASHKPISATALSAGRPQRPPLFSKFSASTFIQFDCPQWRNTITTSHTSRRAMSRITIALTR